MTLGSCDVYDAIFPEFVPHVTVLGSSSSYKDLSGQNLTSYIYAKSEMTEEDFWLGMQPSLHLLDKVCPEVSEWVHEQQIMGHIVWDDSLTGTLARFDFLNRDLTVTSSFFAKTEGEKAAILAHEYRHSRQNGTKFLKQVIWNMISPAPTDHIIENDAYLFEHEVYIAISG